MNKHIRILQVVQIGDSRYGPGKAREAACGWASKIALKYKFSGFREYNELHKIAFHRSLPYFEKMLGKVKNRKNPRSLIQLGTKEGSITATVIDNQAAMMNARIETLKGYAWDYAYDHPTVKGNVANGKDAFSEKFAELLIQDCANIANSLSTLYPRTDVGFDVGYSMGASRVAMEIKKTVWS